MTTKNPAAVALGQMNLGKKKKLSHSETKRRSEWAKNLHKIRKPKKTAACRANAKLPGKKGAK